MSTSTLTDLESGSPFGNLKRAVAETYGRNWFLYVLSGILWLLLGFVALSYRPSSISVAVIFIALAFGMGALSSFVIASALSGALARHRDHVRDPRNIRRSRRSGVAGPDGAHCLHLRGLVPALQRNLRSGDRAVEH